MDLVFDTTQYQWFKLHLSARSGNRNTPDFPIEREPDGLLANIYENGVLQPNDFQRHWFVQLHGGLEGVLQGLRRAVPKKYARLERRGAIGRSKLEGEMFALVSFVAVRKPN